MKPVTNRMEALMLEEKTENLIAIGAATAANCIPCVEHMYEKAITSGLTKAEIKRATDIAGQVKKGAHAALTNTVNELVGDKVNGHLTCGQIAKKACCNE